MGILDFAEEAAGALAAEKGLEAVHPGSNLLEEVAAAAVGFEGVKIVKDHLGGDAQPAPDAPPADSTDQ